MTRVKICGIREEEHALAAAEAGADFIGLVFASSPRQITLSRAKRITAAVKKRKFATGIVGVFVNAPAQMVTEIAGLCGLDWIQLSGDESWQYCARFSIPVIKAIRAGEHRHSGNISAELVAGARLLSPQKHIYLLDSHIKGKYGGTGTTFDWSLARPLSEKFPVIIAGGLTPENVAEAIRVAAPWGVDTSSGVETDGVKDTARILAFITAVRRADGR